MKNKKHFLRMTIFVCLTALAALCMAPPQNCLADNEEAELFLVAQKAFDDGFYDVAMRYITQYLEQYPQAERRIQANLLLGQCYFLKGQYLKAFDIFQSQLQFPEYKDITLYWLGETYLKGSDFEQAQKQYRQLIDVYPNSFYVPQAFYSLGWALFNQKKYEEAKNIFVEFVKKFPTHDAGEDALFKIAESAYNMRAYEEAIQSFDSYIKQFPQSTRLDQAHFYTAESFYYLEKFAEAIENYAKALAVSQDDKILLLSRISSGWCYFKLKDFAKSQEFFDAAQAFAQEKSIPADDIDLGRATLFIEMADYQKALEAYTHLINTFPQSTHLLEAHLGAANASYMLQNYADAIGQYKLIIQNFSSDPNLVEAIEKAHFGLAWTYLKNGNSAEAITTFQIVVNQTKSPSTKVSALTQIGDVFQDIGDLNKALETYDKILKDFPDSIFADYIQYRQGIAFLKLNKIDAATLSFQTLQSNFPNSKYLGETKYYLGLAYFKKGDWAAAKDQLAVFLKDLPPAGEFQFDAQYTLGLAFFNLQDYDNAMKIFQRIIKNSSEQEATLLSNCEVNIAKCLFNLGDDKEAVKRFKIIVYKYPKSDAELESLLWLGDYYLKTSDFGNAITYYQQLIDNFPGSDKVATARYGLGQAYHEQGTLDKALNEYKLIGNADDKELYTKVQMSIADIFSKDVDPATAIDAYRTITANSPEFTRDAHLKIAEIYQENHDYENALLAYQDALKADIGLSKVKSAEIQFNIADLYETLNKINEATETYLKIPYLYPNETPWLIKAYLRLARIFEKEKDWENAKLVYNKIIGYGTEEVKFAQERLDWIKNNVASASP